MKTYNKPTLVDSLLPDFFGTGFPINELISPSLASLAPFARGSILTGDTVRFNSTAELFIIEVDLPGAKKEDTHVEIANNQVYINAKRTITAQSGVREETLTRSFVLDKEADTDTVEAKQEDGVLTITAKRKNFDKSKKRTLKIS